MDHPWPRQETHLTHHRSDLSESPSCASTSFESGGERSERTSPGAILLRRGRFAALATNDTESVGNNSDDCAVEATTACREFLPRRRRRLRITWQDREPTTCPPTQVEPDSHEERLARSDSWSNNHGRGWHRVCARFRQRHRCSVILPKEWVPWIRKARSHVPSDVNIGRPCTCL